MQQSFRQGVKLHEYRCVITIIPMYLVAIAWLYVVLMMAITETSIVAGIMTVTFYGLVPLALWLWLFGTPERKRRRLRNAENDVDTPD